MTQVPPLPAAKSAATDPVFDRAPAARGLSDAEAARRLAAIGPNELPTEGRRNVFVIVIEAAREPMFLLMLGAALLYLVLGDLFEGLFLVLAALATIALVIVQETRSENALAALRDLAQPQARVVRDSVEKQIPARGLVPGDIILIGEGQRLPADALLIAGEVLGVDESTLTGESAPVLKRFAEAEEDFAPDAAPGLDLSPFLFAGALIVRGQGVARISRTGPRSALGRIGASLAAIGREPTPLQKTAGRLVALLGAVALGFCALVAVAYGVLRDDWVGGALAGITFAIALIPEEFPMVLAVFLALGAWRLATHRVLVRRGAVIETLGGASVLCVDKTGTITENRMRVARLWTARGTVALEGSALADGPGVDLVQLARLASAQQPVDPMDRALHALSYPAATESNVLEQAWPLRPDLLAVIQVWRRAEGDVLAAAKGAPEAIFKLCRLPQAEIDTLHSVIAAFAADGLRVLGVASARSAAAFAGDPANEVFTFAGLIGFVDPLRADVPGALREARAAGVAVVMITGDHAATAVAIARAAGVDTAAGVLTGADIAQMSLPTLHERVRAVRVFARIAPEQKLLLVEAFKANGEVVAMTGDGVNDAPALEAAHIGIAMGRRGADVAREAADLILLDDSFASIVGGVRLGRRIFVNLRNALTYITAIHVPIAGLALAPIVLGLPPLLFPMHVVLLELAIDPICALVFEAERSEIDAMKRPPRRRDEALFGRAQIVLALMQGAGLFIGVFGLYAWALVGFGEEEARGAAFIALVLGNLGLALTDSMASGRWFAPSRRIYWMIALAVSVVLLGIMQTPALAALFDVVAPGPMLLSLALAVAALGGGWSAILKRRMIEGAPSGRRSR